MSTQPGSDPEDEPFEDRPVFPPEEPLEQHPEGGPEEDPHGRDD